MAPAGLAQLGPTYGQCGVHLLPLSPSFGECHPTPNRNSLLLLFPLNSARLHSPPKMTIMVKCLDRWSLTEGEEEETIKLQVCQKRNIDSRLSN